MIQPLCEASKAFPALAFADLPALSPILPLYARALAIQIASVSACSHIPAFVLHEDHHPLLLMPYSLPGPLFSARLIPASFLRLS